MTPRISPRAACQPRMTAVASPRSPTRRIPRTCGKLDHQRADHVPGAVGAVVVHHDDLVSRGERPLEQRREALHQRPQVFALVEGGYDEREPDGRSPRPVGARPDFEGAAGHRQLPSRGLEGSDGTTLVMDTPLLTRLVSVADRSHLEAEAKAKRHVVKAKHRGRASRVTRRRPRHTRRVRTSSFPSSPTHGVGPSAGISTLP